MNIHAVLEHFMSRWLPLFVAAAVTFACRTPPNLDYNRIGNDIDALTRFEPKMTSPWQILEILPSISPQTFYFLNENEGYCNGLAPSNICVTSKRLKLFPAPYGVKLTSATPPSLPPTLKGPSLGSKMAARYEALQKANKVYYWELMDRRERVPHFCHQECLCLSHEFAKEINSESSVKARLFIRLFPTSGFVKIMNNKGLPMEFPIHHSALLLNFDDGGWGVVDKIMFDDTNVHSPDEWFKRVRSLKDLSITLEFIEN